MQFARKSWGWYFTLFERRHFKVKLLWFWRGQSCSKQYHNYRAELWLFLRGRGEFLLGGKGDAIGCFDVSSGDSVNVFPQHRHRYTAKNNTLALEIQYGEKCIEEDIIRV